MKPPINARRRLLLQGACALPCLGLLSPARANAVVDEFQQLVQPLASGSPEAVARDERYWRQVARFYEKTRGIVNLEHGYWGKMATPVLNHYLEATRRINRQNAFYARKDYDADLAWSVRRTAEALGVGEDEIVLTRNASESILNLIRQYRGLKPGDVVLYADVDYPAFKRNMVWMGSAYGVKPVMLTLPPRASQQQILDVYLQAFKRYPQARLLLLTHVSNQHGLVVPVREIVAAARKQGMDVFCDNAQSWGLLDYTMDELNVDFAVFNLHKWIGSPVGVGALYIRRSALHKIAPFPGVSDPEENHIHNRAHIATSNFAAMISVPAALDFHQAIGGKNKQARLNYLRSLWMNEAESLENIELLGGADEASRTGMGSFRIRGRTSVAHAQALQSRIEREFGVFTVVRKGLASGACVRVTPQIFNTPDEIGQLLTALKAINRNPG